MKESDEKTIYELKQAKFNLEYLISESIIEFENKYGVSLERLELRKHFCAGSDMRKIDVTAEIKF